MQFFWWIVEVVDFGETVDYESTWSVQIMGARVKVWGTLATRARYWRWWIHRGHSVGTGHRILTQGHYVGELR